VEELPVARPRRLRNKLMLGLALVVGSVGLLLGGTLYGINAYLTTVRLTERKLYELRQVEVLILAINNPDRNGPHDPEAEARELIEQVNNTRYFLPEYRRTLAETVRMGLDPDGGYQESRLLDQLEEALSRLEAGILAAPSKVTAGEPPKPIREDPLVRKAHEKAKEITAELQVAVFDDIKIGIERSNRTIRQSLWIIGTATLTAVALVLTLLYYFRRWIYAPIRVLQGGVQRVHGGDFDHPIELHSQDELEELAVEFNAMAARMSNNLADLARQVNERSRQLVRSERMVSVGFLAAGVAHEINNPLASILFCSEALERRLGEVLAIAPPEDAEVLTRYLKMVQQEALRCKDITQKLLDFSRTGERKREPADLAGLVAGVLEVARHLPNSRGKTITFNPDAYVVAPVNAQDLKSVILNLVVNALDSMDETGSLGIGLKTDGGHAILTFTDTGCGMTPDTLQNIFEPFFTRSRTGKGTGLGLFISHQIIDQHGGAVEAASPGPGRGSTFTVRLPLTDAAAADPAAHDTTDPPTLPFPGMRAAA
jgi:signal transduction histidine kinase